LDILVVVLIAGLAAVGGWILAFGDPSRAGIAGALLGGVLGFASAYALDRSRRRHEAAHRFDEERRATYVRLIGAAGEYEQAVRDRYLAITRAPERPDLSIDRPPRVDLSELNLAVAEIELLSRSDVDRAAVIYLMQLGSLDTVPYGEDDPEKVKWQWGEATHDVRTARRRFIEAARRDLDLPRTTMTWRQERVHRIRKRLGLVARAQRKPPML
jgi:hypothetical protein